MYMTMEKKTTLQKLGSSFKVKSCEPMIEEQTVDSVEIASDVQINSPNHDRQIQYLD